MKHFILVYYILAFATGFASVFLAAIGYFKNRDRRFLVYIMFLAVLTLLIVMNAYQFYRYNISAYETGYLNFWVNFVMSAIFGSLIFLVPMLVFYLTDVRYPSAVRTVSIVLSLLSVLFPLSFKVIFPDNSGLLNAMISWLYGFYTWLFFTVILAGAVFLIVRLGRMADPERKRIAITAVVLCFVFFPGFIADANWRYFQLEKKLLPLGFNFEPLFYILWNAASVFFLSRLLFLTSKDGVKPIDVPDISLTGDFIKKFGITRQEKTVIVMALNGLGNSQIAQKLFISPATVKNHMHNIYEKTGAKNRIGLANIIKNPK